MTEATTIGCLSPEIEGLLLDVLADGFAVYCCGPTAAPLHIRRAEQRPMTIRLPSPDRTEARARRLTPEPSVQGQTLAFTDGFG